VHALSKESGLIGTMAEPSMESFGAPPPPRPPASGSLMGPSLSPQSPCTGLLGPSGVAPGTGVQNSGLWLGKLHEQPGWRSRPAYGAGAGAWPGNTNGCAPPSYSMPPPQQVSSDALQQLDQLQVQLSSLRDHCEGQRKARKRLPGSERLAIAQQILQLTRVVEGVQTQLQPHFGSCSAVPPRSAAAPPSEPAGIAAPEPPARLGMPAGLLQVLEAERMAETAYRGDARNGSGAGPTRRTQSPVRQQRTQSPLRGRAPSPLRHQSSPPLDSFSSFAYPAASSRGMQHSDSQAKWRPTFA